MREVISLGLILALRASAFAAGGDDTLRFFLAKSDLVILGEITSQPVGISSEVGVVEYACDFRIAEVLKGGTPGSGTLAVNIVRFELEEGDRLPELKKGGKCILFLKSASRGEMPPWRTADFWFGVQRPSPWMARSLKRLVEQDEAKAKP
jgi:hypothetical protein